MSFDDAASRWMPFAGQTGAGPGALALYCLPHAGGAASTFRSWQRVLPGVAVQPIQLPGRDSRLREPAYDRMGPLVADLAEIVQADVSLGSIDRRYALYGHSLGALVAFELAREIRRRGGPPPVHLFVSGSVAPQLAYEDGKPVGQMSRPEVVSMLRELGGTPEWLLTDPGVLDMILPAVVADFTIKETYEYRDEKPLDIPITAMPSTDDSRIKAETVTPWGEQTTREYELQPFVGGHFAVFEQAALTHKIISKALLKWM